MSEVFSFVLFVLLWLLSAPIPLLFHLLWFYKNDWKGVMSYNRAHMGGPLEEEWGGGREGETESGPWGRSNGRETGVGKVGKAHIF